MTIFVVTNSRKARQAFGAAERSRTYTVEFTPIDDFSSAIKRAGSIPDSFLYLDVDGMDHRTLKRRLKRLRADRPYQFGIIDSRGVIADVAELFHESAADYLGKLLIGDELSTARLRRVVEYHPEQPTRTNGTHVPEHESQRIIPSGSDWSRVKDGGEYTFVMLYAGIDQARALRRKSSDTFLASLRKAFASLLERSFADFAARVWMWKEDEGLLLLPFDGDEIWAIVPAIRLMLDRVLINVEEFSQFGGISWRLAMHLGNTTYRKTGRTGAIVSESVNFLFHLGNRFVEPGGLAVTGPCQALIPERVRPLLNHRGEFESVHVYSLRDIL